MNFFKKVFSFFPAKLRKREKTAKKSMLKLPESNNFLPPKDNKVIQNFLQLIDLQPSILNN